MFKVGQKIVRNREAQSDWQKGNWEQRAKVRGVDPYGPVEVLSIDHPSRNIAIKEVSGAIWWKPSLFLPTLINRELEDYL